MKKIKFDRMSILSVPASWRLGVKTWSFTFSALLAAALFAFISAPVFAAPQTTPGVTDLGDRLELFVDQHLVEKSKNLDFVLHTPIKQPMAASPLPVRHMVTVIKDGGKYRAWYRGSNPDYTGDIHTGHPGETLFYAESQDGHEWDFPDMGLIEIKGSKSNNAILTDMPPFLTDFMPFLDDRQGVPAEERYKCLAGYPGPGDKRELSAEERVGKGLFAFVSPDGIDWTKKEEVIPYQPGWRHAFDSPNVAFWSEAEQQYVCYFRTWTPGERLRGISRTTSKDFENWTKPVDTGVNLDGEHLYSNNTKPYFRAPHIYLAMPTRFITERGWESGHDASVKNATDVMFMSQRAGQVKYDRPFEAAWIKPGLDEKQWGNRANFLANNIVPTSDEEISIYHRSGHRYTIRTDGFVSATAGAEPGELVTKPITFDGKELVLNVSTSAAGDARVELLDSGGKPIEGFTADDCVPMVGDAIKMPVQWTGGKELAELAGQPVRLRFVLHECDLFSYRFR